MRQPAVCGGVCMRKQGGYTALSDRTLTRLTSRSFILFIRLVFAPSVTATTPAIANSLTSLSLKAFAHGGLKDWSELKAVARGEEPGVELLGAELLGAERIRLLQGFEPLRGHLKALVHC